MLKKFIKIIAFLLLNITTTSQALLDNSFWLPNKSALRFYNNEPIKLKHEAYDKLIIRWQKRLNNSWNKYYNNLQKETGISKELFDACLQEEKLIQIYSSLKEQELTKLTNVIHEKDINPDVLTFIKRTVQKYCTKKNIKIILTPHINTITATFGSDQGTHYLLCHSGIYSSEHIQHYYNSLINNNGTFYIESSTQKNIRFIELSNFLIIGLIEAASHIQHQSNLFTFFAANFKYSDQKSSTETIQLGWHVSEIRAILEAILQSKNPLETALFISKTHKKTKKEHLLWKKLVHEIANCYAPESLNFFKTSMQEIKELYQ